MLYEYIYRKKVNNAYRRDEEYEDEKDFSFLMQILLNKVQ